MKRILFGVLETIAAIGVCVLFYRAWILHPRVHLEALVPDDQIESPVHLAAFPQDPDRLLVSERTGKVKSIDLRRGTTQLILDLTRETYLGHTEAGLLSAVFSPTSTTPEYLFVFYAHGNPARGRVSRFTLDSDGKALPESELIILEWKKLHPHHYGGCLAFGEDGYLYVSVGNDFPPGDAPLHGVADAGLRGAILRLDVSRAAQGEPYTIPPDNPFVDDPSRRPEVWAHGLRNPWRFHYDENAGRMVVGDNGSENYEEHNHLIRGGDYGWPNLEGPLCRKPPCREDATVPPILALGRDVAKTSIPGFTYSGQTIPALEGKYLFAGHLRGLLAADLAAVDGPAESLFWSPVTAVYFKMPIKQGVNRGERHSFSSLHNFGDERYYVTDLESTVYSIQPTTIKESILGFLYHLLKF